MKLRNTSRYSNALVLEMIAFVCGRLPVGCEVTIVRGYGWGRGRGGYAYRTRWDPRKRESFAKPRIRGGSVFVRAPQAGLERSRCDCEANRGYLARTYYGADERFFAILAHEIRHVFQGVGPLARGVKKIRRHNLRTAGCLREVDACLFETRALRRFRREWPSPERRVLPLP